MANCGKAAEPSDSDKVGGFFVAAEERFVSHYEKLQTVTWFVTKHRTDAYFKTMITNGHAINRI